MNQQLDKQKMNQLINFNIDKILNKEHYDYLKEYYQDIYRKMSVVNLYYYSITNKVI